MDIGFALLANVLTIVASAITIYVAIVTLKHIGRDAPNDDNDAEGTSDDDKRSPTDSASTTDTTHDD